MALQTQEPLETETTPEEKKGFSINWYFFVHYRNFFLGLLGAIVLAVGGYAYYLYSLSEKEPEAEEQMAMAVRFFEQDSIKKALNGTSQFFGFEKLAEDYAGTDAGDLCNYYLGICYLKTGKYNEGIEALGKFKKHNDMVSAMAYNAEGYGHEQLKEYEEAAASYLKAADVKANSSTTPFFWEQAARTFEYAGNKEKSLKYYKQIKAEYPLTPEAQVAEKEIARLSQ